MSQSLAESAKAIVLNSAQAVAGATALGSDGIETAGEGVRAAGKGLKAGGEVFDGLGKAGKAGLTAAAAVADIAAAASSVVANKTQAKADSIEANSKIAAAAKDEASAELVKAKAAVLRVKAGDERQKAEAKSEENQAAHKHHLAEIRATVIKQQAQMEQKEAVEQAKIAESKAQQAADLKRQADQAEAVRSRTNSVEFFKSRLLRNAAQYQMTYYTTIKDKLTRLSKTKDDWDNSWKRPGGDYNELYKIFKTAGFNMDKVKNDLLLSDNSVSIDTLSMLLAICMAYNSSSLDNIRRGLITQTGIKDFEKDYAYRFWTSFKCNNIKELGRYIIDSKSLARSLSRFSSESPMMDQSQSPMMDQSQSSMMDQSQSSMMDQSQSSIIDQSQSSIIDQPGEQGGGYKKMRKATIKRRMRSRHITKHKIRVGRKHKVRKRKHTRKKHTRKKHTRKKHTRKKHTRKKTP